MALAGVACGVAWRRMVTGFLTIRGRTGFLVEIVTVRRTTPVAARDFIESLMRQRAAIGCPAAPEGSPIDSVVPEITRPIEGIV